MKWNWYLKLTPEEAERLKEGLKSYFRFKLRLATETVTYNPVTSEFSVTCNDTTTAPDGFSLHDQISVYVNGFMRALDFTKK